MDGSSGFFSLFDSLYCVSRLVGLCVARPMIVKSPICVNMIPRDMASISSINGMYFFLFSFILRYIQKYYSSFYNIIKYCIFNQYKSNIRVSGHSQQLV